MYPEQTRSTRATIAPGILMMSLCVLTSTTWAGPRHQKAAAEPTAAPVEGRVVYVDDREVVVDLGQHSGLPDDAPLTFYRRLVVEHPITGKAIEDRFPIGETRASEVGQLLTIVQPAESLKRAPRPGDYVVYTPVAAAPEPAEMAAEVPTRSAVPAPRPTAGHGLDAVFVSTLGRPLEDRVEILRTWLVAHPDADQASAVGHEIARLSRHIDMAQRLKARSRAEDASKRPLIAVHRPMRRASTDQPIQFAVGIVQRDQIARVRLFWRAAGESHYRARQMLRTGDHTWAADLPPERFSETRGLEYYIQAVRRGDTPIRQNLVGQPAEPSAIKLERPVTWISPTKNRSQAEFGVDYIDFNTSGDAPDRYTHTHGSFRYSLNTPVLRAVKVGVGIIRGEGGPTEAIDLDPSQTRSISLGYGFAEAELDLLTPAAGLALRVLGGNHRATDNATARSVTGFEGRLRLGQVDATRLEVGGSVIEDLGGDYGGQLFAHLHVNHFDAMPLKAEVAMTNLPVGADYGLRLGGQVGFRLNDWLTPWISAGWNARTINHYGFSAGSGLAFNW